jgi:hypothetical protein
MQDRLNGKEQISDTVSSFSTPSVVSHKQRIPKVPSLLHESSRKRTSTDRQASEIVATPGYDDWEMSESTQTQLISNFFENLAPHLPFIHESNILFPQSAHSKYQLLFLAISAASAASIHPGLGRYLASKLKESYAYQSFLNSEKSVAMVQAFLITAACYHPPDQFKDLKFT